MITLYSNDCPKCQILKKKLDDAAIHYQINSNIDDMIEQGFSYLPMLDMNGEIMDFTEALQWLRCNKKD